jgi:type IV secretion system protein VirB11
MTGHPGSPTTIHGRTPAEAFRRMFALCKGTRGGGAMDDARLARMIADAVDAIIPLRSEAGAFRIGEVWFKDDAARRGETAADLLARD